MAKEKKASFDSDQDASERIKELETTVAEQAELINELLERNEKAAGAKFGDVPSVTVDGKEYAIVIKKFIHAGVEFTAESLAGNVEAARKLIEKKSPVLRLK